MSNLPSVFISYNPYSEVEQTLAIRLHTIGSVHGLNMLLPDRSFNANVVSSETRSRIQLCDFFILFSTGPMSGVVQEEIRLAFSKLHDKSKILVIYDERVGKNLKAADNCTEVYINTAGDPLTTVRQITDKLNTVRAKQHQTKSSQFPSLGGILLIGLGLFALNEIFSDDDPPPRRKPVKRKPAKKGKR